MITTGGVRCRALEIRAAAAAKLPEPVRAAVLSDLARLDTGHLLPAPSAAAAAAAAAQYPTGAERHIAESLHEHAADAHLQGQLPSGGRSLAGSQAGTPAHSPPSTPVHSNSAVASPRHAGTKGPKATAAHHEGTTETATAAISAASSAVAAGDGGCDTFLMACRSLALAVAAAELVAQVEAHCSQRGLALARLWNCHVQNTAGACAPPQVLPQSCKQTAIPHHILHSVAVE